MLPKDFWQLVRGLMSAETSGEKKVKAMADKFREAGFVEAADEMEIFAKQEGIMALFWRRFWKSIARDFWKLSARKSMPARSAAMSM